MQKTLGQIRIRVDFNPSSNPVEDEIKQKFAELIDLLESLKGDGSQNISIETARLVATSQTKIEEAAMWAVKAATA